MSHKSNMKANYFYILTSFLQTEAEEVLVDHLRGKYDPAYGLSREEICDKAMRNTGNKKNTETPLKENYIYNIFVSIGSDMGA